MPPPPLSQQLRRIFCGVQDSWRLLGNAQVLRGHLLTFVDTQGCPVDQVQCCVLGYVVDVVSAWGEEQRDSFGADQLGLSPSSVIYQLLTLSSFLKIPELHFPYL